MEGHEQHAGSAATEEGRPDIYDEDGVIRASFLSHVGAAIADRDTLALKRDVGDLHQSELGHLLEALLPEQRRALVEQTRETPCGWSSVSNAYRTHWRDSTSFRATRSLGGLART